MFTLDTNAVIYYLAGDVKTVPVIREALQDEVPLYLSAISEAELFSFSKLTSADERLLDELLQTISVIPVDSQIARIAAVTRRASRLPLPDAIIAATALFTGSTLLTRNLRDFRKVAGLSIRLI